MKRIFSNGRFANVTSMLALMVALGGTSYAAIKLPKDSVGPTQIQANAVNSGEVKDGSLLAADFKSGQLFDGALSPGGNLPARKTIRGTYGIGDSENAANEFKSTYVSFPFQLAAAPTPHFIPLGSTPPAQCPGKESNPQAAAGHLCVYESFQQNQAAPPIVFDPVSALGNRADRWGFAVTVKGGTTLDAPVITYGSWAVTG